MTSTSVSLLVAVLTFGLVARVARATDPVPDGLYRLAAEEDDGARAVPGGSGEPISVGNGVALDVRGSDLRAQGTRNNQFSFAAAMGGEAATPVDPGFEHGGLAAYRRLEPGASHDWDVNLREYLTLDRDGWYEALGTFALELVDPEDEKSGRVVWEDFVSARFLFRVEGR